MATPAQLRLLWLVPYDPWPTDHGGKIRAWEVLSRLPARGVQIDVWYPRTNGVDRVPPPHKEGLSWHGYPSLLGVGRLRKLTSLPTAMPVAVRAVYDKPTCERLAGIVDDYDAVVLDQSYQAPWVNHLPPGTPVALMAHNVEHRLVSQMARQAPLRETRWVYRLDALKFERLERRLFKRADLVAAVSMEDQALIHEAAPSTPLTIRPNGVDLDTYAYRETRPGQVNRLLMTGTLGYPPNFDAALWIHREILPRIREFLPDARIDLVGARCPSALRDLHDPGSGFHVVGYVDDVLPSIQDADVFLMPLQMGGGTRLKALQAMASGLPVVSTAQGVEGLDVTPGREVSLGESGDALAAQCVRLLCDESARRTQASCARKLVEASYGWDAIVDGIHADLVDLVSQPRPRCEGTACPRGWRSQRQQ